MGDRPEIYSSMRYEGGWRGRGAAAAKRLAASRGRFADACRRWAVAVDRGRMGVWMSEQQPHMRQSFKGRRREDLKGAKTLCC